MYKFRNIIPVVLLLLYGCNGKDKNTKLRGPEKFTTMKLIPNPDLIQIDIPEEDLFKVIKKSSILDSVWHVKLQTTEQSLFGSIDQLIVYDESIFILDATNTNSLLEFSLDGKFIKKYGKKGKGPNEYIKLASFGIDKKENRILVFDSGMTKIFFFNRDGSFNKGEDLDFYTSELCVLNSEKILLNNRKSINAGTVAEINAHYLAIIDFDANILSKGLPYNEDIMNFKYRANQDFFQSENEILYHPSLNDTIYSVTETTIRPKYVLNFGNKRLPSDFDKNISINEFEKKYKGKNSPYAYLIGQYMEIGDKLFFDLSYQGHKIKCIYSLKTKTLQFGGRIFDDFNSDFENFSPVGFYKNYIITDASPDIVLNKKGKSTDKMINSIIAKTKISDNPILSFQHFKEF